MEGSLPQATERLTFEAADGLTGIDTRLAGRKAVTSAYLLDAAEPILVETGPTSSTEALVAGLDSLGVGPEDLAHIVVTHIHLDHAGGAGRMASRYPRATVWVHQRGARHLADPTRLVRSASEVFGEERMRRLFGPVEPVPAERIRGVDEGDAIQLGDRRIDVLYTPGHASHHIALADSRTGAVFAGDALGIHLPDVGVLRPATPPPDVDIEAGVASIERIRGRARSLLMFSHFGPVSEVDELCSLAAGRLRAWAEVVRGAMRHTDDLGRIAEILEASTAGEFGSAQGQAERGRYELLGSMEMNAAGLVRYWKKRAEQEAADAAGPGEDRSRS